MPAKVQKQNKPQEKPETSPTPDIDAYDYGPTLGSAITVLRTIKEIRKRILQSWTVTVRQLAKYLNTNKSTKSEPNNKQNYTKQN